MLFEHDIYGQVLYLGTPGTTDKVSVLGRLKGTVFVISRDP